MEEGAVYSDTALAEYSPVAQVCDVGRPFRATNAVARRKPAVRTI